MNRYLGSFRRVAGMLGVFFLLLSSHALVASPVSITLTRGQADYLEGQPISVQVKVTNGFTETYSQVGFFALDFHREIWFKDKDGNIVRARSLGGAEPKGTLGTPDANGVVREAVPCERIPANEVTYRVEDDVLKYYGLYPGHWTAKVVTSLQVFSEAIQVTQPTDPNLAEYRCFVDAPGLVESYEPLESNEIAFDILPLVPVVEGGLQVRARLMKIGTGSSPPVEQSDLIGYQVKLYRRAEIPEEYQPINFKTYGLIFDNLSTPRSTLTRSGGYASFGKMPADDYVMILKYAGSPDLQYAGVKIDATDTDWATGDLVAQLRIMENYKKKSMSVNATKKKGSLLYVFQPEFIEWNEQSEPYPFVFETLGDWDVTTAVVPPEGFEADHDALAAEVIDETESVQFTVTDIGSEWVETDVTFTIEHKGKVEVVKHKIGLKVGPELRKKKHLGLYGQTASPGNFTGGRKVGEKTQKQAGGGKPKGGGPKPGNK